MTYQEDQPQRVCTGVTGLDEILNGGLITQRAYLVRGGPGSGKTTLGMHFLMEGANSGEKMLFITMGESEAQLRQSGKQMGFDLQEVTFLDLSPDPSFFSESQAYDVFSPADVEREPTTRQIIDVVEATKPVRVFLDAVTHLRYLSPDSLQFRKQTQSLLRFLTEQGATVLFTSEGSEADPDDDLQYMSDGILYIQRLSNKRTVEVTKYRGSDFQSGVHAMTITDRGLEVFPRLVPEANRALLGGDVMASGVPELDEMLHGGLERGTVTMITGPSGVGKTTLALQYMKEAAGRGEHSLVYSFEEGVETLTRRGEGVNMPIATMVQRGTLHITAVEPLHYSPDEFAHLVRRTVDELNADIVLIDSISGYSLSLRGEDLVVHLHGMVKYLQNRGVTVILIQEIREVVGEFRASDVGISYIADNIIFLRYLEYKGEMRRAIGVLKKRLSDFEKTLREYTITRYGIRIGAPLSHLRGVMTGIPTWDSNDQAPT
jgi:circadian clock protein KaiC